MGYSKVKMDLDVCLKMFSFTPVSGIGIARKYLSDFWWLHEKLILYFRVKESQ